jgi:selenoprotein W-related protein
VSLAESLLVEFGPDIQNLTLVPSGGGIFDVRVGEDLVFSKFKAGHFPQADEIKSQVRERLKG